MADRRADELTSAVGISDDDLLFMEQDPDGAKIPRQGRVGDLGDKYGERFTPSTVAQVASSKTGIQNRDAILDAKAICAADDGGVLTIPPVEFDLDGTLEHDPQAFDLVVNAQGARINYVGSDFVWELVGTGAAKTPRAKFFGGRWIGDTPAAGFMNGTRVQGSEWGFLTLEDFSNGVSWALHADGVQTERNHVHHARVLNCKRVGQFTSDDSGSHSHARTRFRDIEFGGGGTAGAGDHFFFCGPKAGMYDVIFDGIVGNIPDTALSIFHLDGNLGGALIANLLTEGVNNNAVYRVNLTGSPTGGTFPLSLSLDGTSIDTAAIAFDASTGAVGTAVTTALGGFTAGGAVTVTGVPGAWVLTFDNNGVVVVNNRNSLTGGSSPAVVVTGRPYLFTAEPTLGAKPALLNANIRGGMQFSDTLKPSDFGGSAFFSVGELQYRLEKRGAPYLNDPLPHTYQSKNSGGAFPFGQTGVAVHQSRSNASNRGHAFLVGPSAICAVEIEDSGVTFNVPTIGVTPSPMTIPADKTADYAIVATDVDSSIGVNSGSAKNVTVPLNATSAFPIGRIVEVRQVGAGQVTLVPESGSVTLRSPGNALKTRTQYSVVSLMKIGTNTWSVTGDVTT